MKKQDHHEYEGWLNSDKYWKRLLGFTGYTTMSIIVLYIAFLVLCFISGFMYGILGLP